MYENNLRSATAGRNPGATRFEDRIVAAARIRATRKLTDRD